MTTPKIPAQTPNPGRFQLLVQPDLTLFTIANVYDAPTDGSDMKLVTYMDHIRNAEPLTMVFQVQLHLTSIDKFLVQAQVNSTLSLTSDRWFTI